MIYRQAWPGHSVGTSPSDAEQGECHLGLGFGYFHFSVLASQQMGKSCAQEKT